MKQKRYGQQLLAFTGGAVLLGTGTACFIKAGLGADAMSTFALGLHGISGQPIEVLIFIIMYTMMGVTVLLNPAKIRLSSLLYPFISNMVMHAVLSVLVIGDSIILQYALAAAGVLLMAFAIAVGAQVKEQIGCNPYDALAFSLQNRFSCSYACIRWCIDAGYLIIGLLLGASIGIGTLGVLLFLGPCAEKAIRLLDKYRRNRERTVHSVGIR